MQRTWFFFVLNPILWCDNLGATYLTSNPILHYRTMQMKIDLYFIRDRIAAKTLTVHFCSSKDQLADIFTKPFVTDRFSALRSSLSVIDATPLNLRGCINLSIGPRPNNKQLECITKIFKQEETSQQQTS